MVRARLEPVLPRSELSRFVDCLPEPSRCADMGMPRVLLSTMSCAFSVSLPLHMASLRPTTSLSEGHTGCQLATRLDVMGVSRHGQSSPTTGFMPSSEQCVWLDVFSPALQAAGYPQTSPADGDTEVRPNLPPPSMPGWAACLSTKSHETNG
ncbi:hypothetical protein VTI28DRAFT_205 [Corynascus sepedonium]